MVCRLPTEPSCSKAKRGTRTHKRPATATCSRQAPTGRLAPAITIQFRGLESNQRPPRSERGVTTSSNYPGVVSIREGGFEPPPPDSKSGSLPVSRFPRASRGSRTRLSDLGSPCLTARPRTLCSLRCQFQIPVRHQSGIGDSNPGRLVGSQESCRWTNPACVRFRAEGEGVEPSRLIARPSSSRVPSPIGLPFRQIAVSEYSLESSTGGRSRTSNRRLNRAPPYR